MSPLRRTVVTVSMIVTATFCSASFPAETARQSYSEVREPCLDYAVHKKPLFGDLHTHSSLSFDSYLSSQRNGPTETYQYAKGYPITLPNADGKQTVTAQIDRPLDFAALTDHGEFLGQVDACKTPDSLFGRLWPMCVLSRSDNLWLQLISASWWTSLGGQNDSEPSLSAICLFEDCSQRQWDVWQTVQRVAEEHYDRSEQCEFTTFVAYEYTDASAHNNLHRNVIFRNANVTERPLRLMKPTSKSCHSGNSLKKNASKGTLVVMC